MSKRKVLIFNAAIFGVIGLSAFNFALSMGIIMAAVTAVYIWATLEAADNPPINPHVAMYKYYIEKLKPDET